MKYFTIPGDLKKFFVTFHGTGGNEYSLLSVTGDVDPDASIISFLGETGIGRSRRYFDPLITGQLPRENVDEKVAKFLDMWDSVKPTDATVTFMGYSNGANFILAILEKRPDIADKVVLLHPSDLGYKYTGGSDAAILVTIGASDTISLPGDTMKLVEKLKNSFPGTRMKLLDSGHEISSAEIGSVGNFMKRG